MRQALQRKHRKLHDARQDRHRADRDVAAVFKKRRVEADRDDALACLHDKRRRAKRDARQEEFRAQADIFVSQPQQRLFSAQKCAHPDARHALRENGCQSRAANAHVEHEDEQRVEHNVADRANQHSQHAGLRKALRGDERVHAERQLDKNRADGIDAHIADSVVNRVFARAKSQQQGAVK